jgi:hypothetical protein
MESSDLRPPAAPEPPPPSPQDVEQMRAHRDDVHNKGLSLRRDVSFGGNASATAPLSYIAPTPARGGSYSCGDCPGRTFPLPDDPYIGTPERRAYLRTFDKRLATLLAGVAPATSAKKGHGRPPRPRRQSAVELRRGGLSAARSSYTHVGLRGGRSVRRSAT